MTKKERNKYKVGKWYKDCDDDFIKFDGFDIDGDLEFTASVMDGEYKVESDAWIKNSFAKCIPMTQDEMKKHLPESEWWIEPNNDLFPIY